MMKALMNGMSKRVLFSILSKKRSKVYLQPLNIITYKAIIESLKLKNIER